MDTSGRGHIDMLPMTVEDDRRRLTTVEDRIIDDGFNDAFRGRVLSNLFVKKKKKSILLSEQKPKKSVKRKSYTRN